MSLDKFISTEGYKANSPDRNNPYNIIQSGRITMKGVPHPVYGMDELGNGQMMYPGQEYMFPGGQVTEVPVGFHMMPDGQTMPNSEHPGYEEMELTDEEIEEYRKGGYIVEEVDKAQKGKSIPVSDPNDPRLHMYLDSLNLYKGYQKAQELFPEEPTPGGESSRLSGYQKERVAKGMPAMDDLKYYDPKFKDPDILYHESFDDYWKIKAKRDAVLDEYRDSDSFIDLDAAAKDQRLTDLGWNTKMDAFKTTKDLRQDDTNSGDLAQYYADELTFKHPTSVGYWHSPDLGSSKIPPADSYFGEAWNPVYKKPVQPYEYTGDPADVAKLRHPAKVSGSTKWAGKSAGTNDPKFSVAVNLRKRGMDSSFAARKKMAAEAGIDNYTGSKAQNVALNDYVFANYEGDKRKEIEPQGGTKPLMGPTHMPKLSDLKKISETAAIPDPEAPEEIKKQMKGRKAPTITGYTQKWDADNKKWTQEPVIEDIAIAPGIYQDGGSYSRADSAAVYNAGKAARDFMDIKTANGTMIGGSETANEYARLYKAYQKTLPRVGYDPDLTTLNDFERFKPSEIPNPVKRKPLPQLDKVQSKPINNPVVPQFKIQPGIPKLPTPTITGYTQSWNPELKKWEQEPQYQVIAEPGMYAYGGDIQVGGGYNYNEINSLKDGGGIHIDPSKKGTFTAAATKHGKGVQEFASQVLANKENYSPTMVKKANFARNAAGWKKQDGGAYEEMDLTDEQIAEMRAQGYIVEEL